MKAPEPVSNRYVPKSEWSWIPDWLAKIVGGCSRNFWTCATSLGALSSPSLKSTSISDYSKGEGKAAERYLRLRQSVSPVSEAGVSQM